MTRKGKELPERRKTRAIEMDPHFNEAGDLVGHVDEETGEVQYLENPIPRAEMDRRREQARQKEGGNVDVAVQRKKEEGARLIEEKIAKDNVVMALVAFSSDGGSEAAIKALERIGSGDVVLTRAEVMAVHGAMDRAGVKLDDGSLSELQAKGLLSISRRAALPERGRHETKVWGPDGKDLGEQAEHDWSLRDENDEVQDDPFVAPAYVPKRGDVQVFDGPEHDKLRAELAQLKKDQDDAAPKAKPPRKSLFKRWFGRSKDSE